MRATSIKFPQAPSPTSRWSSCLSCSLTNPFLIVIVSHHSCYQYLCCFQCAVMFLIVLFMLYVATLIIQQQNSSTSEGMVNDLLKEEMSSSIHALSIQAKTPKQWEESKGAVADTPGCIRPAHVPMK